jgi:hypothetical protein
MEVNLTAPVLDGIETSTLDVKGTCVSPSTKVSNKIFHMAANTHSDKAK